MTHKLISIQARIILMLLYILLTVIILVITFKELFDFNNRVFLKIFSLFGCIIFTFSGTVLFSTMMGWFTKKEILPYKDNLIFLIFFLIQLLLIIYYPYLSNLSFFKFLLNDLHITILKLNVLKVSFFVYFCFIFGLYSGLFWSWYNKKLNDNLNI